MKKELTFSEKLKAGWTPDALKEFYALTEKEFQGVLECLKVIQAKKEIKEGKEANKV